MLALSLICTLTLIWSGVAKLRAPGSARTTLLGLGLPAHGVVLWGAIAMPFVELFLGLSWLLLPARWALVSAAGTTLLFLGFLIIVVRAYRDRGRQAECMCFGSERSVGPTMIARNAALTLMAASAVALLAWQQSMPGEGSSVVIEIVSMFASTATAPAAIATLVLTISWFMVAVASELSPQNQEGHDNSNGGSLQHGVYDEFGGRTVSVGGKQVFVPKQADQRATLIDSRGAYVTINNVANSRGSLVVFTKPNCHSCSYVLPKLDEYRDRISPMSIEVVESTTGHTEAEHSGAWRDPYGMAGALLEVPTYPAALVLLKGGAVPVGPVFGPAAIDELVDELNEVLVAAQQEVPKTSAE